MCRSLVLVLLVILMAVPAAAQRPRPLGWAMDAVRDGDWEAAARIAQRDGDVAADIVEWHRLRSGRGTYGDVVAFLDRRPDWPGERYLRRQSENVVASRDPEQILTFFAEEPPQTAAGVLAYARALTLAGEVGEAEANVVIAWRTMSMDLATQRLFLRRHRTLIAPHHIARLDRMLWNRDADQAQRMFTLVSDGYVALAQARIALQERAGNVDALIRKVPKTLADHPGLARDRMEWRMRKGRSADAMALMLARSTSAEDLGDPEAWATRRRQLARSEMREGDPKRAYELASKHFLTDGRHYADLEWLSGYLALRYLDDPASALTHFENFDGAVVTPVSKGRAGYWRGRALEALGRVAEADMAYAAGGQHQTAFYGLLAAERANLGADPELSGREPTTDWRGSDLSQRDLFQAGMLLQASGELTLAERFWTHLAESLSEDDAALLGQAALDIGHPHLAVMIGKRLAQRPIVLPGPYFPLHPVAEMNLPMVPEMVLAIARRESEFDPVVSSGVGARGLMQIMPQTGKEVARQLGRIRDHTTERLMTDPTYNAELGAAYLATLAKRFDGNVIMVAAGYNAGPSRPIRWMKANGDPRKAGSEFDVIDWIEHIPFDETRNYVMRVAESLPVYRARLGRDPHPVPFSAELTGSTLGPTFTQ